MWPSTQQSSWKRKVIRATAVLIMIGGCSASSGPEKVIVQGAVTFAGKPVANGEVLFYPIDGTPGSVSGGPIKEGQYTAKGRGGVPVGKHRVEIRAFRPPSRPGQGDTAIEGGPAEQYLPQKYNAYSELTCDIDASSATQDFNLLAE